MAWERETGIRVGARWAPAIRQDRALDRGDRALGFAAWGAGLAFNTLPVRSGYGEL